MICVWCSTLFATLSSEHWLDKHYGIDGTDSFELSPSRNEQYLAHALQVYKLQVYKLQVRFGYTNFSCRQDTIFKFRTVVSESIH